MVSDEGADILRCSHPVGAGEQAHHSCRSGVQHSRRGEAVQLYVVFLHLKERRSARIIVLHIYTCLRTGVFAMKTNITLKLEADLLLEARVLAAEQGRSVSGLLADQLEVVVRQRKAFDQARRRALARLRDGLNLHWTPPKSRDELHER